MELVKLKLVKESLRSMDLFNRKARFEEVVHNEEALLYHAVRYQSGARYPLAKECWQYVQAKNMKNGR